ncbi:MAG: M23 family metallopeptidase, partial [Clostridia bacterium]|nr:M23 family metallopeptidase [Clostridia bacterium]
MKKRILGLFLLLTMIIQCFPVNAAKKMGYIWPVPGYYMTSSYTGTTQNDHRGIDIATSGVAANVYAAKSGTIMVFYNNCEHISQKTSCNDGIGNGMMIDHGDGTYTQYAHMTLNSFPSNIYAGAHVEQGQLLGQVGSSGMSTGYHLHFEIRTGSNSSYWRNTPVNPMDYVDTDDVIVTEPPTGAWIWSNKTLAAVGEEISFNYNANGATAFVLGIDKTGVGRIQTLPVGSSDWYTTSFSEAGTYTIYATCYNSAGGIDSEAITFNIY